MPSGPTFSAPVKLARSHRRADFACEEESLNDYIRKFALQNQQAGLAQTWVLSPEDDSSEIAGFYSLSAAQVSFEQAPADVTRRQPRYPIPAVRISQLARDKKYKGTGVGSRLVALALKEIAATAAGIGVRLVLVDAVNERAVAFYESFGFQRLRDNRLSLVVSLADVIATMQD